jgi:hypothetical protein
MTLQQKAAAQNNHIPPAARAPYTAIGKQRDHLSFALTRARKSISAQQQAQLLAARKARRPKYPWTAEIKDAIVSGLLEKNLYRLCNEDDTLPARTTVLDEIALDAAFAARCARADKLRAQKWATKIELEAEGCTEDNAQSAKVKISAYQWLASKEDAKYGEKTAITGADGDGPVQFVVKSILDK